MYLRRVRLRQLRVRLRSRRREEEEEREGLGEEREGVGEKVGGAGWRRNSEVSSLHVAAEGGGACLCPQPHRAPKAPSDDGKSHSGVDSSSSGREAAAGVFLADGLDWLDSGSAKTILLNNPPKNYGRWTTHRGKALLAHPILIGGPTDNFAWRCCFCGRSYASGEQFYSLVKHFVSKKHMTGAAGGADLPGMRLVVDRSLKLGGSQVDMQRIGRMAATMGLQRNMSFRQVATMTHAIHNSVLSIVGDSDVTFTQLAACTRTTSRS